MARILLHHRDGNPREIDTAFIVPYEAHFGSDRHPTVTPKSKRDHGFDEVAYLLGAFYREEPLLLSQKPGEGGEYVDLSAALRIQFLSDDPASPTSPIIDPKDALVVLEFYNGQQFKLTPRLVRPYQVREIGSRNARVTLGTAHGCEPAYLHGALMRREPLLLAYEPEGANREIVGLHGVSSMHILPPGSPRRADFE